jgi:hypothetical protein
MLSVKNNSGRHPLSDEARASLARDVTRYFDSGTAESLARVERRFAEIAQCLSEMAILGEDCSVVAHVVPLALDVATSGREIPLERHIVLVEAAMSHNLLAVSFWRGILQGSWKPQGVFVALFRPDNSSQDDLNELCFHAAAAGHTAALTMLLEAGASPDGVGDGGPLARALRGGNEPVTKGVSGCACAVILLRAGASLSLALQYQMGLLGETSDLTRISPSLRDEFVTTLRERLEVPST